jgi:hypothetical protein
MFQVHHRGVRGVGELQHGERADRLRVRRGLQRQDLEAEARPGSQVGQAQQLGARCRPEIGMIKISTISHST